MKSYMCPLIRVEAAGNVLTSRVVEWQSGSREHSSVGCFASLGVPAFATESRLLAVRGRPVWSATGSAVVPSSATAL
jgi:hypothetical protein